VRIACVGGGPGGLYFAALTKLGNPGVDVTVYERNPAGVTYGWGVSYSFLLAQLQAKDPQSARAIRASSVLWRDQEVFLRGQAPVHLGGYGFNIGRKALLDILGARARELGVRIESETDVTDVSELGDVDLVVASDGVRSRIRTAYAERFGTTVDAGGNKHLWLGTRQRFGAFAYGFEQTAAGWIWFYGYNFSPDSATFIVECCASTWKGLGFDAMQPQECTAELERIFRHYLGGNGLINQSIGRTTSRWQEFLGIRNETWMHDNVVLMGDAAHTTHFSIGSGTTLAMEDAIVLADRLCEYDDVQVALKAYESTRRPVVQQMQEVAANSLQWFEHVADAVDQPPVDFGYSLLRRRYGMVSRPRDAGPRWRYGVHLATQNPALRKQRLLAASLRTRLRPHHRD
jgi:anthraniloyl-CoA monooxygenase